MMPLAAAALIVGMVVAAPAGDGGEEILARRGSEGELRGSIISVDDAGVRIRTELGAAHLVPWDRVREVRSTKDPARIKAFSAMATDLWRARSRLERGDAALAEPLLVKWFPRYLGQSNETAMMVATGLAYCRIARGASDEAIIPMLEALRLRRAGLAIAAFDALPPLFDAATDLAPATAPMAVTVRDAATTERQLAEYNAHGDAVVAAIAGLYRAACRQALGLEMDQALPAMAGAAARDHVGTRMLLAMIEANAAGAEQRESARQRLLRELGAASPWAEAWIRLHVGTSLLREKDAASVRRGMIHLVHLPARFQPTQPELAALALRRLAEAAEALGDSQAAAAFRAELDNESSDVPPAAPISTTSTGRTRS